MQPLTGQVAIVTGAGRGIGRAHALTLSALGAAVLVNDVGCDVTGGGADVTPAAAVVNEIVGNAGRAVIEGSDISTFAGGAAVVAAALDAFGRLDIVVNNAGIISSSRLEEISEATLERLLGVHLFGAVGTARAALPIMRRQGYGRIVNTVSEAALDRHWPADISYAAAKAAVWGATYAMAAEVAGSSITVNAVSPGARTRMNEQMFAAAPPPEGLDLDPFQVARVDAAMVMPDAGHINGRVVHAAAGAVREYQIGRTRDGDVVEWLVERLSTLPRWDSDR